MTKARIRAHRATIENASGPVACALRECLDEIERLQSYSRRGATPDAEPEPFPKKAKAKADPRIAEFTSQWEEAFLAFHKETYPHGGAKDVMAIKRLLNLGKVSDLLDTAWDAWHHPEKFNCAQAITIAGFASRYANVKLDLKLCSNGGRPPQTQPAQCNL